MRTVIDELVNGAVTRTCAYGLRRISENQLISETLAPSFYGYDGAMGTFGAGASANYFQIRLPGFHGLPNTNFAVRARLSPLFDVFRRMSINSPTRIA
jgi:hypothetical protein